MRRFLASVAATVIAALAIIPTGSTASDAMLPKPDDPWIQVRTANFTIFSAAPEQVTRAAGADLEQLRSVLQSLFDGMSFESPVPTYIFVFDGPASFQPYTLHYRGNPVEQVGGYFGSSRYASHLVIAGRRELGLAAATIYHEYLHSVLNTNLPDLPLWLNEGLAEFYSTFTVEDGTATVGRPDDHHISWLRDRSPIPTSDLIAIDKDSPDYHEGPLRRTFYAQSWALTHMLVLGRPGGPGQIVTYMTLLRQGMDREDAFQQAFEASPGEIEQQLEDYVDGSSMSVVRVPTTDPVGATSTVAEMAYAEVLSRLGDLLTSLGSEHHDFAAEHYRTALAYDEAFGPAVAGLGRLDELAGRSADALARYRLAAALSPDDFMVQFLLGNRLCHEIPEAEPSDARPVLVDEARAALERAVVLRPGFGDGWASLGQLTFWDEVPGDTGIEAMEHAHRLLPNRADVGYNLAALYANADRSSEIESIVARMKAAGVDASVVRATEALIPSGDPSPQDDRWVVPVQVEPTILDRTPGFTDRYNEAVRLVNSGELDAAIAALEELTGGEITDREAASAQTLLDRVRSFVSFQSRADEATRLANEGEVEAAIAILEPLVEAAPEGAETAAFHRTLSTLYGYRDFQATYNLAVDHFNSGDFDVAARVLEPLVRRAPTPRLASMATRLLNEAERLR